MHGNPIKIFFLTGFMAVGKTYWAKRMGSLLDYTVFDLDEVIERHNQNTISEIINLQGEPYFRELESEILRELIATLTASCIISLGGGTLINARNLELVKNSGTLIWLKRNIRPLNHEEKKTRPLFIDTDIDKLYSIRKEHYSLSDYCLDLDSLSNDEIESRLTRIIES